MKSLNGETLPPPVRFSNFSPLLARDSTLSIPNKLTLYKLCIRPILTYAAPVWSNTSSYNYRRLQISQSKCLRVIGNFPRRTPIPHLHTTLNVTPIRNFIYHLTANFFDRCPAHPNHLVRSIGNYYLADLHYQCMKYILSIFSSNHFPPTTELHWPIRLPYASHTHKNHVLLQLAYQ